MTNSTMPYTRYGWLKAEPPTSFNVYGAVKAPRLQPTNTTDVHSVSEPFGQTSEIWLNVYEIMVG